MQDRLSGGRFKRTCTDHEVEIVEAEEGAAYGAAILAGVGAKIWPSVDAACDAVVRVVHRVQPNPCKCRDDEEKLRGVSANVPGNEIYFQFVDACCREECIGGH